jgi:hypothetical protein
MAITDHFFLLEKRKMRNRPTVGPLKEGDKKNVTEDSKVANTAMEDSDTARS